MYGAPCGNEQAGTDAHPPTRVLGLVRSGLAPLETGTGPAAPTTDICHLSAVP
jgi:hypothetical protein